MFLFCVLPLCFFISYFKFLFFISAVLLDVIFQCCIYVCYVLIKLLTCLLTYLPHSQKRVSRHRVDQWIDAYGSVGSPRSWSNLETLFTFWLQEQSKFENFTQFTSWFLTTMFHGGGLSDMLPIPGRRWIAACRQTHSPSLLAWTAVGTVIDIHQTNPVNRRSGNIHFLIIIIVVIVISCYSDTHITWIYRPTLSCSHWEILYYHIVL